MNGNDELIRRAMHHLSRHGYAVGGVTDGGFAGAGTGRLESPDQRPSSSPGAGNTTGSNGNGGNGGNVGGIRDGGFGGFGGAGRLGPGGINRATTRNEMRTSIFDPDKASARLGPNAAQAMAGAGVDPDRALVAANNINRSGVPASGNMLTQRPSLMDRSLQNVLDYSPQPTVQQQTTMPAYAGLKNSVMGTTMGSPYNNVIQYGMPVTGTVKGLPGAMRNPLDPNSPMRYHSGVDIKTAPGAETVSMVPGKVAQLGTAGGYGSFVDIMNYDGTMTRYATHDTVDPSLAVGDTVLKGQTIGTSGALPGSNFSHLHMEQLTPADRAYQEIAAAFNAGATTKPVEPGGIVGRTSNYNKNASLTSTQQLLDRLGLKTGSQMQMDPNSPPSALAAGPQSIVNSGYYDQTPASAFPEFDRLDTFPSYSQVGNSLMGETVNSPYNNTTQSFYDALSPKAPSYGELENVAMGSTVGSPYNNIAKSSGAAPVVASAGPQSITPSGLDAPQNTAPSPSYMAQAPINLPRPRPDNLAQLAQAQIPLPQPRPANLTQTAQVPVTLPRPRPADLTQLAQVPVTLPRPRPAALDPVNQALQVASNFSNFQKRADNISRDNKSDREGRGDKDNKGNKKGSLPEADEKALTDKGYTKKQIEKMTQEEIDAILRPENVAGVVPPVTPTETAAAARGGRMGYAQGGRNQENRQNNSETSSNKKSTATPTQPLGAEYLNLLPSLPAYQPINYMTGTGTAATAPSPAIASFNNFATQQVPQMMPPSYSAPSGNTDYVGNNAVANAMRMLRMRQLLEQ